MSEQVGTARVTGAWYLGLAVTGVLGVLLGSTSPSSL